MSSIFLSHTSIDKPFVEKLAKDMEKYGIRIWYDKYEIKVGESILWKIDEGIEKSDFLGIVISKEAWESEWVRKEIEAAWNKQMEMKSNIILPIFYRDCDIPLMLRGIKYADFRKDYYYGLKDLLNVFGIKNTDILTEDNWRNFTRKNEEWKRYRDAEFEKLITSVCKIAKSFKWSVWVGRSKNPYSVCLSIHNRANRIISFSIRMVPNNNYRYLVAETSEINPSNIPLSDYKTDIGFRLNEVEEYTWNRMEKTILKYGESEDEPVFFTDKYVNTEQVIDLTKDILRKTNWNQEIV
ncbi:toll/interleukin-1 receptor domain-containing protein [Konateibacter massiliensis]|uniref:toll/interleukin-1 receptor domain-containing protein n=1 Tax=Konateibacter massiliensis TaxID=2002841 RepID=UPI000C14C3E7|nr:toll/interleukin-1 receptor domain-containing protein [Konateibacter massiliensis]